MTCVLTELEQRCRMAVDYGCFPNPREHESSSYIVQL